MTLITSFFSDPPGSSVYANYAKRLEEDLQAIGLEYEINPFPYQGSWLETCRARPAYLQEVLNRVQRPIAWIDVDSRVRQPIPHLDPATYDVAAPASKNKRPLGNLLFHIEIALLYLNNTAGARSFLADWRARCEGLDWPVSDHCHFLFTWAELGARDHVKLLKLPLGVCGRKPRDNAVELVTSQFAGKQAEYDRAIQFHKSGGTAGVPVYWWPKPNFGDWLTPLLARQFQKHARWVPKDTTGKTIAVGSIINCAKPGDIVWGSGISKRTDPVEPRADYRAVRGPLTRQRILDLGGNCPEIYGDPALLLPRFHRAPNPTDRIGIVPHHRDCAQFDFPLPPEVMVIDTRTEDVLSVVDKIASCRAIISSSLHGLILAHAYGVPARWVVFDSRNPPGDGVKFYDFYASVKQETPTPLTIQPRDAVHCAREIAASAIQVPIDLDLDRLMSVCPWK